MMIHQRQTVRMMNSASVTLKTLRWILVKSLNLTSVLASFSEVIPSKWGLVMDRLIVLSRKFSDTLTHVQSFIWRVLELHIVKIVAFFVVWVALLEVCTRFISC